MFFLIPEDFENDIINHSILLQSTVSHVCKQCINMEALFSSKQAHLCLADTSLSEFSPFQSKSILIPHSSAAILVEY